MVESGVFFQRSGFLGEKWAFLGEKVHRAEKRTEQNSTVEQTRAEQKRVDITAENSRAEQN